MTRRGPRTIYGPKQRPSESVLLTPLGRRILYAASKRCRTKRSNVWETLLRLYGGTLEPELFKEAR